MKLAKIAFFCWERFYILFFWMDPEFQMLSFILVQWYIYKRYKTFIELSRPL